MHKTGACLAAVSPCAAASEAPAAAEGEPDAVVVGDVEDVIADVLATESDKEKQQQIAASIEHQLTHNHRCYMCEVCLRCKTQRRQKRKKVWSTWAKGLQHSELSAPETISSDSVALILKRMLNSRVLARP